VPLAGYQVDSKHSDPWIIAIGKFMINFGAIEQLSFSWVESLSKDPADFEKALDLQLSKRIDLILRLVERSDLSKQVRREIVKALGTARLLARLRNDIAHSPLVFGWRGPADHRPPDFIGSFNAKKLKGKNEPRIVPLVDLKVLNQGIDDVVEVGQQLYRLLAYNA
jgi:hypothetical protein